MEIYDPKKELTCPKCGWDENASGAVRPEVVYVAPGEFIDELTSTTLVWDESIKAGCPECGYMIEEFLPMDSESEEE